MASGAGNLRSAARHRLVASYAVRTYNPDGQTLHAGGHDASPVVIGKDVTGHSLAPGHKEEDRLGKSEETEHLPRPEAERG